MPWPESWLIRGEDVALADFGPTTGSICESAAFGGPSTHVERMGHPFATLSLIRLLLPILAHARDISLVLMRVHHIRVRTVQWRTRLVAKVYEMSNGGLRHVQCMPDTI